MNGSAITFATDAERIAFHVELETEGERSPCQVDAALAPYTARDDLLALRVEREELRIDRARLLRERDDLERIIRERDFQLAALDEQIAVAEALLRARP